jgi:hypothetical protein
MSDDTHNEYSKNVGLQRRRKEKEGEGRRRKEKEGEGRRRKEKEGEGRRRKEKEGEGRREEVIITRKTRILPVIDLPLRGGGS